MIIAVMKKYLIIISYVSVENINISDVSIKKKKKKKFNFKNFLGLKIVFANKKLVRYFSLYPFYK